MTFIEQFPIVFAALNEGFLQTLKLFFVTLLGALPLGLIMAFGSMSKFKPLSAFVKIIVWLFRGSPLMIQLLIVYYFPGLILGNNWWGSGEEGRFIAASVAFILNYACYFSEIYRGGIESISKGQYEAGQVLGMTKTQIFFKVILLYLAIERAFRDFQLLCRHFASATTTNECLANKFLLGVFERHHLLHIFHIRIIIIITHASLWRSYRDSRRLLSN